MKNPFQISRNKAVVFVDYEYWYISMRKTYGLQPDIKSWAKKLREQYEVKGLYFFANFVYEPLKSEIVRIREVTNNIIETQSCYNNNNMKDMSDFIMLDFMYQEASKKKSPKNFILFTGDGHFLPVARYLVQDKNKDVTLYGVKNTVSRALKEIVTQSFDLPNSDDEKQISRQFIIDEFERLAQKNKEVIVTFRSMSTRIANYHHIQQQAVEMALADMLEQGLLTKVKRKAAYAEAMINIIIPHWDKLIEAGLYTPK